MPEILGRLRRDAEHRLDEPSAPRWARPVGWAIAIAIVAVVIFAMIEANPL
jgi:hypothetical protein